MNATEVIEQTVGIGVEGSETMDRYEYYKTTLLGLKDLNDKLHWSAGDLLNDAKGEFGEEVVDKLSYDVDVDIKTLKQWAWVSGVYRDPESRNTTRSWSHYRAAAATESPMLWVIEAENNGWSERKLREEIKNSQDMAAIADGVLCSCCNLPLPDTGSRHVRMDGHKEASLCSTKCTLTYYLKVYENEESQLVAPSEDVTCEGMSFDEDSLATIADIFDVPVLTGVE